MNKWICRAAAFSMMFLALGTPVLAESYEGGEAYYDSFEGGNKLDTTVTETSTYDTLSQLQPGDDATFTVEIRNNYKDEVNYWMKNSVVESFEDASKVANSGAYGYVLTYYGDDGQEIELFNSSAVGGETDFHNRQGLHEATEALEDYFFLDAIPSGKAGKLVLNVALDGEAYGNACQDTVATLQMAFAVELESIPTTPPTSDPTRLMPYMLLSVVSGLVIMAIVLFRIRSEKEGE